MIKLDFKIDDWQRLTRAYQEIFGSPQGQVVLRDLAKVCNAATTTFDKDPYEMARKEGMRQVWLIIQAQLNITDDDVIELSKGQTR